MIMQYPKLVESKTAANKVTHIEWNPGMDLLATVFSNGALTCSRLLSLQKVWQKQPNGKIISIAWRPDGRVLAIAAYDQKTKTYICTLHDVEDGKEVHSITVDREITSIAWFSCVSNLDIVEKEDPIKPKKSAPFVDTIKENFSHQLAHQQTQLNILLISDSDGKVDFYALGLFLLGEVNISDDLYIFGLHMSSCMRYITATMYDEDSSGGNCSLKILKFDTFQEHGNEILKIARMYAKITDELEYLEDTFNAIKTSWTDVLAGLDNKLSSYCSRRNTKPDESGINYTFISADDLLQLLVIGHPSDNLEKFIADMSDKGLRKLNTAIEQTCQRVQALIVKNAQKCCYHLHSDLNLLRGMSLWRERFQDVGLDDKSIVKAMQDVGSLMLKLTELQQVIDHSLKSTKSFFRWMISIACRVTGEQNTSVVPNDVNKTTQQDVQFITDFILENFDYNTSHDDLASFLSRDGDQTSSIMNQSMRPTCSNFTLEQVGQYLKMESLTRLKYSFMRPETNFWIEFFKQRPNLTQPQILEEDGSSVLLFYPHHANTSLVQEHHDACRSIETAFKSVADNFYNQLKQSESVLVLRDYVRGTSANRVRIETDMSSMSHYMLFQTKPSPTTKRFLLTNNLEDKSFRLLSIEFHTVSATPSVRPSRLSSSNLSNLVIEDSNFYDNRDTKKMQLTFLILDRNSNDTLLVQVELDKLLGGAQCFSRPHKDFTKVFRSNDTIEKHSVQHILKIDLNSEPPSERKHEPEMMVKRIRGVMGVDMFASSSRGVIAFTSCEGKRLHIYELESTDMEPEIVDDEVENDDKIDESLMETDLLG